MESKKFTQQEETMIVKNAMELTATILYEELEMKKTQEEKFRPMPSAPVRKILSQPTPISPQYPKAPKTMYKYSDYIKEKWEPIKSKIASKKILFISALIVLAIICIICPYILGLILGLDMFILPALAITYYNYIQKRKSLNQQLSQSDEYQQAVKEAEEKAAEQTKLAVEKVQKEQEDLDAKYEAEMEQYNNVTIPQYNEEQIVWSSIREKKIAFLDEEINYNKEALNEVYDKSKLISIRYRELWILKWLYDDMSSADHDIRYATELLDRERQLFATNEMTNRTEAAINAMRSTMEDSMDAVYDAIEHGNSLQEQSIDVLSKTRRDANIGTLIGTVQRPMSFS